jgi:hypothetical protein
MAWFIDHLITELTSTATIINATKCCEFRAELTDIEGKRFFRRGYADLMVLDDSFAEATASDDGGTEESTDELIKHSDHPTSTIDFEPRIVTLVDFFKPHLVRKRVDQTVLELEGWAQCRRRGHLSSAKKAAEDQEHHSITALLTDCFTWSFMARVCVKPSTCVSVAVVPADGQVDLTSDLLAHGSRRKRKRVAAKGTFPSSLQQQGGNLEHPSSMRRTRSAAAARTDPDDEDMIEFYQEDLVTDAADIILRILAALLCTEEDIKRCAKVNGTIKAATPPVESEDTMQQKETDCKASDSGAASAGAARSGSASGGGRCVGGGAGSCSAGYVGGAGGACPHAGNRHNRQHGGSERGRDHAAGGGAAI